MARKIKVSDPQSLPWTPLLEGGDHRGARAAAEAVRDDPAAPEEARRAAAEAVASLAPEKGAVVVGVSGVLLALGVLGWTVLSR